MVQQGPPRDYTGLPLDNRRNDRYSHITKLASAIMKASCSMVILGHNERVQLANAEGLEDDDEPWLPQFCAWALGQPSGLLAIEDMRSDERTKDLTWVSEPPDVNFYAGASLHNARGERIGVLCVMDFEAKPGSTMLCQSLPKLGEMVMKELLAGQQAEASENLLYKAMDTYWDGSVLVDTNQGHWLIKYANEAFGNMTGIHRGRAQGRYLWDLVEVVGTATTTEPWTRYAEQTKAMEEFFISPVAPMAGASMNSSNNSLARLPRSRPSLTKKFKIHMRKQTAAVLENHGLDVSDAAIQGIYYAVFSPLVDVSLHSLTSLAQKVDELVPFEGVEMGPMIGKGSFGSVFKATWDGRMVAIKVIESGDIAKVDASGNPLEASLMLGMKHPNVIETIQYSTQQALKDDLRETQSLHGSAAGSNSSMHIPPGSVQESWLMLEFCDIGTLSDGLVLGLFHEVFSHTAGKEEVVPKMWVILETARDIARGLGHIHSHNILHGDLTAGNILLAWSAPGETGNQSFTAKIADFGLSRQAITSKVETNTYGTVTHMPPELLNEGILSKAADVYAYGVLLYEIFTKKTVWEGLRHPQIIHAIAVMKKHPELPDTAPKAFKDLADACMSGEPEDRPTFGKIIDLLDCMITTHMETVVKP